MVPAYKKKEYLPKMEDDSLCQKVYKIKMETDIRNYSAPVVGQKHGKRFTIRERQLNELMPIFSTEKCTI
jgi:hypothetical protein